MPARLRIASPEAVAEALGADPRTDEQTRLLVKHFLAVLCTQAPGRSVEVRVPPYAAVQAIPGVLGTGLFLGMADVVLVGDDAFNLIDERTRKK